MYTSRTLEAFRWRAKEPLSTLSLRNNAIEALKCSVFWRCRRWPMCAQLRRTCSSGVLHSATLTGTNFLSSLWMELQWQTGQASRIWTWSRFETLVCRNMKEPWTRFPEIELSNGSYWAVIVQTENKDPRNLFTTFLRFVFFLCGTISIFWVWEVEKRDWYENAVKTSKSF